MKFNIDDTLSNVSGDLKKFSTEILCETNETDEQIQIVGFFNIIREIESTNKMTEIKDRFPVNITIPKNKRLINDVDCSIRLNSFNFEILEEITNIWFELELLNVKETV